MFYAESDASLVPKAQREFLGALSTRYSLARERMVRVPDKPRLARAVWMEGTIPALLGRSVGEVEARYADESA